MSLNPCPCGGNTIGLLIQVSSTFRWRTISAHCTGEHCPSWEFEIKVAHLDKVDIEAYAHEQWNKYTAHFVKVDV